MFVFIFELASNKYKYICGLNNTYFGRQHCVAIEAGLYTHTFPEIIASQIKKQQRKG